MKKIGLAFGVGFIVALAATLALSGCGAEWAACETCKPGEPSAQADDGKQIPVDVKVDVNVDVDVTVNQSNPPCQTCGTSPVVDAGTPSKPDAGCPPKKCRRVCTKIEHVWTCGKHHQHHCGSCSHHDRCVKEEVQCS